MNALELALSLEIDLEKNYFEQAEQNKDNSLHSVFLILAKEEENHANILRKHRDKLSYDLPESEFIHNSKDIFKDVNDFKLDIKDIPSQLDSYRAALEKEKQSFELYEKLLNEMIDEESKEIFHYLLRQEEIHCNVLENIIHLLIKPEEWVESAEFGVREEY